MKTFFRNKIPIWPSSQSSACWPSPRRSRWCWWSWPPSSPTSSSSSPWSSTLASAASTTTSSSASPSPTFLSPVLRWHSMRHKKFWAGECHLKSWGKNKLDRCLISRQPPASVYQHRGPRIYSYDLLPQLSASLYFVSKTNVLMDGANI